MKSYSSKEIIAILHDDGWREVRCKGDHHHFRHPTKPGTVTVTHPLKDIPRRTLNNIAKQAGVVFP